METSPLIPSHKPQPTSWRKVLIGAIFGAVLVAAVVAAVVATQSSSSSSSSSSETSSSAAVEVYDDAGLYNHPTDVSTYGSISFSTFTTSRVDATFTLNQEYVDMGLSSLSFTLVDDKTTSTRRIEINSLEGQSLYMSQDCGGVGTYSFMGVVNTESTTEEMDKALESFMQTAEARTLPLVSFEAGTRYGLSAREYETAMGLHKIALYSEEMYSTLDSIETTGSVETQAGTCWTSPADGVCKGTTGKYFYEGCGTYCSGMCGVQCTCWYYVCGDCCWHKGCYMHDTVACAKSYLNSDCASGKYVLWGKENGTAC
eukprot:TRINITY_DN2568_c0_g1::TRINITY_DN2568_c0_g1_i2::g.19086::m.19086 TRINITY_DN2568_c0_g1::TRINITY_DN2568_c0_g1_i2::g.19086  ORF type:complete len:333 (+),score=87.85,DUF3446/PF11928.3/0.013,DUF3357/PF11837.3/0.0093 TRINITY_DN2568_c0_g1_i2:60-1001(+)